MTKNESVNTDTTENSENYFFRTSAEDFKKIPGSPIAYWMSDKARSAFAYPPISQLGKTRRGLQTGAKDTFIREWFECGSDRIEWRSLSKNEAAGSPASWFVFNNGGQFRKWFGNIDQVVLWKDDGCAMKATTKAIIPSESLYFAEAVCWARLTSGNNSFRLHPHGVLPGDLSPCYYSENNLFFMAYLNSRCANYFLGVVNPTITKTVGDVAKIPCCVTTELMDSVSEYAASLIKLAKLDWDASEISMKFTSPQLLQNIGPIRFLNSIFTGLVEAHRAAVSQMRTTEEAIDRLLIEAYGLQYELTPDVPLEEITLTCNPRYRYAKGKTDEEYEQLQRTDTMKEFISYAIGCMMGRYSIDTPGLQFAGGEYDHAEACKNAKSFTPDDDGILPVLTDAYFEDDVTGRFVEFMVATFGKESLSENLQFIANALGVKGHETPQDTIRRYLANNFYKDHLKTYKKRPIYWLFSSGKEKAFQALVYLHRYTPATLARMRTGYLHELQNKMRARIDDLEQSQDAAATTAQSNRTGKDITKMRKQLEELRVYDEKLHHYADQRIEIDLDDGVKHNYGLFGDLLKDVKAVTGKT